MSLEWLFEIVRDRLEHPQPGSYTTELFQDGLPRIAQKVGEESAEVIVAALAQEDRRVIEEVADLTYHVLVLLAARGLSPQQVGEELERRHRRKVAGRG